MSALQVKGRDREREREKGKMSSVADVNHNGGSGGIKGAKDSSVTVGDVGSGGDWGFCL